MKHCKGMVKSLNNQNYSQNNYVFSCFVYLSTVVLFVREVHM